MWMQQTNQVQSHTTNSEHTRTPRVFFYCPPSTWITSCVGNVGRLTQSVVRIFLEWQLSCYEGPSKSSIRRVFQRNEPKKRHYLLPGSGLALPDCCRGHKELKRIIFRHIQLSMLDLFLQIFHLFLSVTGEAKFLLEAPENGGASLDRGLAEHVVKDHHLVEGKFELKVCTLTLPAM